GSEPFAFRVGTMDLSNALVEPTPFDLNGVQLRNDRLTGKARVARQPLIAALRHNRRQLMQSFTSLRGHQPELMIRTSFRVVLGSETHRSRECRRPYRCRSLPASPADQPAPLS